jgi:hypothetical protein
MNLFAQATETTTIIVTDTNASFWATLGALWIVWVIYVVVAVIGLWKLFEKAGEAGWKSIVPLYNTYTLFRIAGRNGLWFLGLLIPFVNIIVAVILALDLAKHFGKSTVFAVFGLILFTPIGYMILGYGDAKYVGAKHA